MNFYEWLNRAYPDARYMDDAVQEMLEDSWRAARTMTPVSERLPDHNEDVLVFDGNDYMRAYYDGDDWWIYNVKGHKSITHWIELPEVVK